MGAYIADFLCHGAKILIEVDGGQHGLDRQAGLDRRRDRWFASQGYRVLRFWNHEILFDRETVLDTNFAHVQHAIPSDGGVAP